MTATPHVARAALHQWEEPVISGSRGSGTVFFVGCPLSCRYCQNVAISQVSSDDDARIPGVAVDVGRLARSFLHLEAQGAHNVNLVTATHHAPHAVAAVREARRQGLSIPIVYNTSGYELPEAVDALAQVVDVWLTDFKYADSDLALRYSRAADYPAVVVDALRRMHAHHIAAGGRQVGPDGTLRRGLVVRHLLLPGALDNGRRALDAIYEICGTTEVDVSVMNQYTPTQAAHDFGCPLDRPVTALEYERLLDYADDLDFEHVWWQQGGTVDESFVPAWDGAGV